MKTLLRGWILLVVFALASCVTQRETGSRRPPVARSYEQGPVTDYQIFYDDLSPYGTWVEYPRYGYVWMPDQVEPGFTPYATAGRWIFTDDGWTWVSDYSWGWAPFHYGRWDYDGRLGWFWVPDYEWAPAWVVWRSAPGYYGWTPLRPGVSISVAMGRDYRDGDDRWVFVRDVDMMYPDIGHRFLDRRNTMMIINNSTVIVNTRKDDRRNATYIAGPDRDEFQRATRTRIDPVIIRENDRPGHHLNQGELQLYRPRIEARSRTGRTPVPQKLKKLDELQPVIERDRGNQQREGNPPVRTDQPTRQRERTQPPAVTPGQSGQQQTKPAVTPPSIDRKGERKAPPPKNTVHPKRTRTQPPPPPQPKKDEDEKEKRRREQ